MSRDSKNKLAKRSIPKSCGSLGTENNEVRTARDGKEGGYDIHVEGRVTRIYPNSTKLLNELPALREEVRTELDFYHACVNGSEFIENVYRAALKIVIDHCSDAVVSSSSIGRSHVEILIGSLIKNWQWHPEFSELIEFVSMCSDQVVAAIDADEARAIAERRPIPLDGDSSVSTVWWPKLAPPVSMRPRLQTTHEATEEPKTLEQTATVSQSPENPGPVKPQLIDRELLYDGHVCRTIDRAGTNLEILIRAFDSAGWPDHIPNPFDSVEQLRETIKSYNSKSDKNKTIRFRVNHLRVIWEFVVTES